MADIPSIALPSILGERIGFSRLKGDWNGGTKGVGLIEGTEPVDPIFLEGVGVVGMVVDAVISVGRVDDCMVGIEDGCMLRRGGDGW